MTTFKSAKGGSLCVKCGACTAVCPVYRISGRESHSARGKHHIIERLAASDRTAAFDDLISKCILCGACRDVCSGNLDTAKLVVEARSKLSQFSGTSFLKYLTNKALTNPSLLSGMVSMGAAVNRLFASRLPEESGLQLRLAAFSPEIMSLPAASYLDTLGPESQSTYENSRAAPSCTYFVGCLANHLKPEIGLSVSKLVNTMSGSSAAVPQGQTCCGMASLAAGNIKEARRLAQKSIIIFETNTLPIITSCASCYSHLQSYPDLFTDEPDWLQRAKNFAARLREFASYFLTIFPEHPNGLVPQSSAEQMVFYHDPCHLRFKLNITAQPRRLLASLPGLTLHELPNGPQCCGQGGLFRIVHPDLSKQIRDRLVTDFLELRARTVVTTCSGCLLQWQQGLAAHDSTVRVLHLALLLQEYID